MSKSLLYSDCKYPNVNDFNNSIFRIENILVGDYNIFISRNYNKRINNFRNIIEISMKKQKQTSVFILFFLFITSTFSLTQPTVLKRTFS